MKLEEAIKIYQECRTVRSSQNGIVNCNLCPIGYQYRHRGHPSICGLLDQAERLAGKLPEAWQNERSKADGY